MTIADATTGVPVGGEGYVPSGSIARITSLVLVGALLLRANDRRASRSLLTVGAVVLVLVLEAISRLYLGRHLVLDVIGGFALGLALFLALSLWVRPCVVRASRTEDGAPSRTTGEV